MLIKGVALSLLTMLSGVGLSQGLAAPDSSSAAPKKPVIFDPAAIDKTADPCTDFYQYSCGNWKKANPIPADQARWGRFNELSEYNRYSLYLDLKQAAAAPKSPLERKYGDFFAACMNTAHVDALGAKPIEPELHAIDALQGKKDFTALNVALGNRFGSSELFGTGIQQDQKDSSKQIAGTGQGGLTLPDRDYYLLDDDRSKTLRQQYVEHVTKMFTLLGDTPQKAAAEAASVLEIETALAKGSMSRVEMRDPAKRYHIMTVAELQALTPDYSWKQYLAGVGLPEVESLNVSSPGYVKAANEQLENASLDAFKSYLRWHTLHGAAPALSKPFVDENFNFFGKILNGQQEDLARCKRCTR